MAATDVDAIDIVFSRDSSRVRTYDVTYRVKVTSQADHAQVAMLAVAAAFPFGTAYVYGNDSDPWCFARRPTSAKLEKFGNWKSWLVKLPYTNRPLERDEQNDANNPLDEPLKIGGSFISRMRAATKDRAGNAIDNSADEPILPAPEVPDLRDTIIVERNTASIDFVLRSELTGALNDAPRWGLPANSLLLEQWAWDLGWYGTGSSFVKNRWEFSVDVENLHKFITLDQIFRIKNGVDAGGKPKYITLMDDQDQPLRQPVLGDGAGDKLVAANDPVELEFDVIREADYTQLPLPDPLF